MSTLNVGTVKATTLQNSSGVEVYTCKAWVNFNGTDTVAIRASGNVSSITDNGNGDYTINFTTAMQDADFNFVATAIQSGSTALFGIARAASFTVTTTDVRLGVRNASGTLADCTNVNVVIFR